MRNSKYGNVDFSNAVGNVDSSNTDGNADDRNADGNAVDCSVSSSDTVGSEPGLSTDSNDPGVNDSDSIDDRKRMVRTRTSPEDSDVRTTPEDSDVEEDDNDDNIPNLSLENPWTRDENGNMMIRQDVEDAESIKDDVEEDLK